MSPFERPTGSFSNPAAGAEAGQIGGVTPDVSSAAAGADGALIHHVVPMTGTESAAAAQAKVAAEAGALAGKAIGAVGHAAIGAIPPPGGEPISPIIQLIMKLPGATGLMSNFFEFLQNFFSGEGLMKLFDPALFHASIGSHVANLSTLATGAQHFTVSLAHMPGDTLGGMFNHGGHGLSGTLDWSKLGASPAEHFTQNPANVGAPADLNNAQFEAAGATGRVTPTEGTLAGPSVTHGAKSDFLAGNQRLFSDQIGSGGANFNSVTSNTNVPTTTNAIPNTNGATFGAEANSMNSTMSQAAAAQPAMDVTSNVGSNASSAANNVVANNDVGAAGSYRPSMGGYWNGQGTGDGGTFVEPLKAKTLSFEDLHKAGAGQSKSIIDHIGHQAKGGFTSGSRAIDSIGHQTLPKAFSTSHNMPHVAHTPVHHVSHSTPVQHHTAVPKDTTQIAQATDASATPTPTDATGSYTVQKGDSLWSIAQKNLGDGNKWTEIYKLNSDVIGQNPDLIFSGTELKLPGMDSSLTANAGEYVVKPGDNLWDIAQKNLGDGTKWGEIYKANADVIGDNPRLILPGQHFTMPGAQEAVVAQADPNMMNTAQAAAMPQAMPIAQQPMPVMQQAAMPVAQQPVMMQQPIQIQAQPLDQGAGAASAATINEGYPVNTNGVIQVAPQQELPPGPGAAGAATIKNPADSIVSSSLAPDMSWLKKNQ